MGLSLLSGSGDGGDASRSISDGDSFPLMAECSTEAPSPKKGALSDSLHVRSLPEHKPGLLLALGWFL